MLHQAAERNEYGTFRTVVVYDAAGAGWMRATSWTKQAERRTFHLLCLSSQIKPESLAHRLVADIPSLPTVVKAAAPGLRCLREDCQFS